jgi:hypothetical protein
MTEQYDATEIELKKKVDEKRKELDDKETEISILSSIKRGAKKCSRILGRNTRRSSSRKRKNSMTSNRRWKTCPLNSPECFGRLSRKCKRGLNFSNGITKATLLF